jgi:hypothetical protein
VTANVYYVNAMYSNRKQFNGKTLGKNRPMTAKPLGIWLEWVFFKVVARGD